jgi:hypothetical protein
VKAEEETKESAGKSKEKCDLTSSVEDVIAKMEEL